MSTTHASLSPSSAERWFNCPGSVNLITTVPAPPPSFAAVEGTVAHEIAEKVVSGKIDTLELMSLIGTVVEKDGMDIEVTEEMIDAAIEYHDIIKADTDEIKRRGKPAPIEAKSEVRVQAKSIDVNLWGTADFLLYQKGNILRVYDFKYGKGVIVDSEENKQMAIYAVAAMDTEAGTAFDKVELVIIQPRAPHRDGSVRRWEVPKGWFDTFRKELKAAVADTRDMKAATRLTAGEWCRFCPAKAVCPAIYGAIQKAAEADFSVVPTPSSSRGQLPDVRQMSLAKLAAALAWEEAINSWYESVKLRIREALETGGVVPGYKLVDGKSNRKWVSEDAVIAQFSSVLGEKVLFEKKLLSPAKLEKIVGKGRLEELGLTMKPEAPKAIAKDTDPRPTARSSAAEDFTPVNGNGEKKGVEALWP